MKRTIKTLLVTGVVAVLLSIAGFANAAGCVDKSQTSEEWRYQQLDH